MRIYGHASGSVLTLAERLADCPIGLRWGGAFAPGAINGEVHLLDGLQQLQALEAAQVPHVELITDRLDAELRAAQGVVLLGRKRQHTQGFDIRFSDRNRIRGQRNWLRSEFWTVYNPALAEWRFHILNGKSIARGLKVWVGGEIPETRIRSRRLGWHMSHTQTPPKALRELAKAAVAAVGYQLGAVDIIQTHAEQGLVCEINSRPSIRDEYTLFHYADALRALGA